MRKWRIYVCYSGHLATNYKIGPAFKKLPRFFETNAKMANSCVLFRALGHTEVCSFYAQKSYTWILYTRLCHRAHRHASYVGPSAATMHDWLIDGHKVGVYYEAPMLDELRGFKELQHTFTGKNVRRFDDDIDVGGIDASNYISFTCALRATRKMTKGQLRSLLNDTTLLNTKNAPSLIYVEVGSKVCVCAPK